MNNDQPPRRLSPTGVINDIYAVDKQQVRAAFDHAALRYDAAAVLQHEVGRRMLERLDYIKIAPACVVDVGAGTGRHSAALAERYKKSQVIALDFAPAMLTQARRRLGLWSRWSGRQHFICGDAERLPLAAGCVDLIFSNLTLQWCNQLDPVFQECMRVLRPGGLLIFSTLGPDTLKELRASWAKVDGYNHINSFIDMHDIGDALTRLRYSDPVMDVEHITLTYPDVPKLMRDLKTIGAHNVTAGRPKGLTGKQRLQSVAEAYEPYRKDGVLPATYEVVYGHAWAPLQHATAPGTVTIPVHQLRRRTQHV